MKGLILKDLYMVWNYCKMVLVACIIFLACSVFVDFMEINVLFSVYPVVIAGMIPFTVLVYEEKFKWAAYCQSFPVTRKQVVTAKYLLSFGCILFAVAVSVLFSVVRAVMNNAEILPSLSIVISTIPLALMGASVMLPFVFKYDVEKSRIVYYIVVGGICGLSAFISVESQIPDISGGIGVIAGVVIMIISWILSMRFYENKDL